MDEMFVVHLMFPIVEHRQQLAQKLSEHFHISVEKMEKRLTIQGPITKPLPRTLADSIAALLIQGGAQVAVVREHLSDVLVWEADEPESSELQTFVANIHTVQTLQRPTIPAHDTTKDTRPVLFGVLSILFLIITLTFGVSFTFPDSEAQNSANTVNNAVFLPKHEVLMGKFVTLPEVLQ